MTENKFNGPACTPNFSLAKTNDDGISFEGKERRMAGINACLQKYGLESLSAARELCLSKGIDVEKEVRSVQPIAFENAVWAYTLGVAVALQSGAKTAAEAASAIGVGLQAFCIPGSVADQRKVGIGHGNLGKMLLQMRQSASLSLRVTNLLQLPKANRHCPLRQQSPQGAFKGYTQWSRQGRSYDYSPESTALHTFRPSMIIIPTSLKS